MRLLDRLFEFAFIATQENMARSLALSRIFFHLNLRVTASGRL